MKRAAPGCVITHPTKTALPKGGAAHEKDSVCWHRLPSKYTFHCCEDRSKNDFRDALNLAQNYTNLTLSIVHLPTEEEYVRHATVDVIAGKQTIGRKSI